jgi:hypothetical protein
MKKEEKISKDKILYRCGSAGLLVILNIKLKKKRY